MSVTLVRSYRRLSTTKFPGLPPTYERLVEAMMESVCPGKPDGHLLNEIRTLAVGRMGVWPLREGLDRMYQTYLALCRPIRKVPVITDQSVVGIYLRYLRENLGAQVRDLASDVDLESLYTAAKFAAAREDRRITLPLLRDARGPEGANGDVTGLFPITRELTGSHNLARAGREQRPSALFMIPEVNRPSAPPHEEGARQLGPNRRRQEFQGRQARPMRSSSRVSLRPYAPRTRYGFEDIPGRDRGHPVPRDRVVDRRYSADPRPTRWPQVHMTNVQPPVPELAISRGPKFHSMATRRIPQFQPAAVVAAVESMFCVWPDRPPVDELG